MSAIQSHRNLSAVERVFSPVYHEGTSKISELFNYNYKVLN